MFGTSITIIDVSSYERKVHRSKKRRTTMKHTNSRFVVARLVLVVLTLAIAVFSLASCEGLPPEIQGLLGGNPNANCEHEYDNACDFNCNKCGAVLIGFPEHYYDNDCDTDCNECGATRTTEHVYDNASDTDCNTCGATRTIESDNTRYTITEEEWNAALKLRNFTYVQAAPSSSVEYKVTETAIHLSSGSVNRYVILKDGITYYSEDGVNWKVSGDNFDSLTEHYVIEDMIGHAGVTFTKFLEVYEYSEESKAYVRTLANGGTAEFRFADGKLVSFIANGQTPVQITNVGTTVVEYSAFNIVDEIKPACQHANVENCVCKDCGEPVHLEIAFVVTAMAPNCGNPGYRCDVYICNNCEGYFYDETCKREITDVSSVIIPPLGHQYVGGVCERCGSYNGGDNNDSNHPGEPTPFELACRELASLYSPDNKKATSSDYELVPKIVIEGEVFEVTWTIANESITVTYDADKDVYIVDVPDEVSKNCYYSLEAAILNNSNGRTIKYQFIRLLEATVSTDGDGGSSVCQHKSLEYMQATPDIACNYFGVLFDIYVCCDCLDIFYDAECKNKVPYDTTVTISPTEHKYVGDICEKCGFYMHEGMLPSRPSEPTPLESAYFYIIDLYYDDNKTPTPSDYELVSKVVIEGEEFAVTWTVANESITVTYDADKDVYVVNVPDVVNEKCYYSIKATISDGEGNTISLMFARVLMPSEE